MDSIERILKQKADGLNLTPSVNGYKGKTKCKECSKDIDFEINFPYKSLFPEYCSNCIIKQRKTVKYEDKMRKNEVQRIFENMIKKGLPPKYQDIETDQIKTLESCMDKSIYIWGKCGTGKSIFAASLAKKYLHKRIHIKWISFPKFIMELQSCYRNNEDDPFEFASEVAKFEGVLFIDDLGAEKLTDYVKQIIYYLINEREDYNLLTVITSNYSLAKLDEQVDSRISSRIAGMCKVIEFSGEDRRLKYKTSKTSRQAD